MKSGLDVGLINQCVYQAEAHAFDQQRNRTLFEKPWLDQFLALLDSGSHVLDLGCGSGRPISEYMIHQGHHVTGLDFAPKMLQLARGYFPRHEWVDGDIRELPFQMCFDGVISWDAFFHLSPSEQRLCLPQLACRLNRNGALLLTIGHEAGEVTGTVNGRTVYHASLSIDEYRQILEDNGMSWVGHTLCDPALYGHSVILAQRQV